MSSNGFGEIFRVTTFGESHGAALGVVIEGVPAGFKLDISFICADLARRRGGANPISTARNEADLPEFLSGLYEGVTTGAPICAIVRNADVKSEDYEGIKGLFRPGHGDYSWQKKFGVRDPRGGARLSGRETVARVIAGAVAKQILNLFGVKIQAYVTQAAGVLTEEFDETEIEQNPMRCPDKRAAKEMLEKILAIKEAGDSAGGVVEIVARGLPAGLGDPVFDKLDAKLAQALVSIGAVKGVEFGVGFKHAAMKGSESNDKITPEGFKTNNAGGILGGISTGAPIVIRIAVKPTPSIAAPQNTINEAGKTAIIKTEGRHDACICPRIVPVAEAMTAITLLDALLRQRTYENFALPTQFVPDFTKTKTTDDLHKLRGDIENIDAEIIRLIARRAEVSKQIGAYKKSAGLPVYDETRERELKEKHLFLSQKYKADLELIGGIFRVLIEHSKGLQK